MKTSPAITNSYLDFKVLNLCRLLRHTEGSGPYLVTQDGSDPGDLTQRACSFVLTHRGTWLHYHRYVSLEEDVRADIAHFATAGDLLLRANGLPMEVTVETESSLNEFLQERGFAPSTAEGS